MSVNQKGTMHIKRILMGLVLLTACSGVIAPAVNAASVPIPATAILDTAPGFNATGGAALLTDGNIGGNNWLSTPWQYLGWTDPGYVPTDGGSDSGAPQPQLTFNLGGTYFVDSI